jgi:hypothetical protein
VLLLVGSAPFVVYLIVAPTVAQLKETFCALLYVPGVGLAVGVATLSVYVNVLVSLSKYPLLKAWSCQ